LLIGCTGFQFLATINPYAIQRKSCYTGRSNIFDEEKLMMPSRQPRYTSAALLEAYQSLLAALSPETPADEWKESIEPLIQRTLTYLESIEKETKLYSANDLADRLVKEDIEVYTNVSLCILHRSYPNSDETDLNETMTEMIFDAEDANYIQFEETNATLLDFAARFGIDPDKKVWMINETL
jgi:hypothetical protein